MIHRVFLCLPTYQQGLNNVSKWPTKMADKRVRNQAIPDPRWESVYDSHPLTGIKFGLMVSQYKVKPSAPPYWNKGRFIFFFKSYELSDTLRTLYLYSNLHLRCQIICQKADITVRDWTTHAWFPLGRGMNTLFPTLEGNQISSDEEEQDSDTYIGAAYGSTYWNKGVLTLSLLTLRYDIHHTIWYHRDHSSLT